MDILDFVDSQDIREHLRSIDFQPSTIEAAYLVWFSKTATLDQKCEAWQEIARTMAQLFAGGNPCRSWKAGHPRFPCFFALDNRLQQAVRRCVCEWDGLRLSI